MLFAGRHATNGRAQDRVRVKVIEPHKVRYATAKPDVSETEWSMASLAAPTADAMLQHLGK